MNNENTTNNVVTMDAKIFSNLVAETARFDLFKKLLIETLTLTYRGTELRVEDDKVIDLLRAIDEEALNEKYSALMEEYKKKYEEENADE